MITGGTPMTQETSIWIKPWFWPSKSLKTLQISLEYWIFPRDRMANEKTHKNAMSPDDQAELGGTQTSWKIPKWWYFPSRFSWFMMGKSTKIVVQFVVGFHGISTARRMDSFTLSPFFIINQMYVLTLHNFFVFWMCWGLPHWWARSGSNPCFGVATGHSPVDLHFTGFIKVPLSTITGLD